MCAAYLLQNIAEMFHVIYFVVFEPQALHFPILIPLLWIRLSGMISFHLLQASNYWENSLNPSVLAATIYN